MRVWVGTRNDGGMRDEDDAQVSILDHGFTVGDGIFETVKVTAEGPFALTRHLARLVAGVERMGTESPDLDIVRIAVADVIAENRAEITGTGRLRITYTAGRIPMGKGRKGAVPTLVVSIQPAEAWAATTTAVTLPWPRNERSPVAGIKTTSYAENVLALVAARGAGADEGIFGNTVGDLCEGTASNVFVVRDGEVWTPPLASGCLAGVTRELLIEWFGAREERMSIDVLKEADEVFVTSSTRNVHPVVRMDARTWSAAGPISRDLQASFDEQAARDLDP